MRENSIRWKKEVGNLKNIFISIVFLTLVFFTCVIIKYIIKF